MTVVVVCGSDGGKMMMVFVVMALVAMMSMTTTTMMMMMMMMKAPRLTGECPFVEWGSFLFGVPLVFRVGAASSVLGVCLSEKVDERRWP